MSARIYPLKECAVEPAPVGARWHCGDTLTAADIAGVGWRDVRHSDDRFWREWIFGDWRPASSGAGYDKPHRSGLRFIPNRREALNDGLRRDGGVQLKPSSLGDVNTADMPSRCSDDFSGEGNGTVRQRDHYRCNPARLEVILEHLPPFRRHIRGARVQRRPRRGGDGVDLDAVGLSFYARARVKP